MSRGRSGRASRQGEPAGDANAYGEPEGAAAEKELWAFSVGCRPHTVTVRERPERNHRAELRWTRSGTGKYHRVLLRVVLRDPKGRIITAAKQEAMDAATRANAALRAGLDPRQPIAIVNGEVKPTLTIAEGLSRALVIPGGMYPIENDHVREMRRYRKHVLRHLPNHYTTWESLTSFAYCELWRALAAWRKSSTTDGNVAGRRSAEQAVVLLAQAGRWLKRAGILRAAPEGPQPNWKKELASDWMRITHSSAQKDASRLRYSAEEFGKLLWALDNPEAGDPRIRLMLRLGAEARLGQVRRCRRSDLVLTSREECAAGDFGQVVVEGRDKKLGVVVGLSEDMRAHIDHELCTGYLRDLERAYQSGTLSDYFLFPAERLRYDVAPSRRPQVNGVLVDAECTRRARKGSAYLDDRSVRDMYCVFEANAGVAHVAGRGWYGIRRRAADIAEDVEADGRALNAITGHASDTTRRRIYQEKLRKEVQTRAGRARTAARELAREAAGTGKRGSQP